MCLASSKLLTKENSSKPESRKRMTMNVDTPQMIRTQSPLRAWYLATFGGMKVFTRICQPSLCVCGIILYQHSWVLVHGDQSAAVMTIF